MKYEVSNIIFKEKPSGKKMARKYPFKRLKELVNLVEDTPYNLYLTYKRGFSFKPHPFNDVQGTLHNARVRTIVLDFDHLTPIQKDFVQSIVDGKYQFSDVYGDYSAGTKTRLYENRDIPGYVNPKWGYKVFFPVDCLCAWSELNREFTRAVAFFNPIFPMDEVERIWAKWLKANNRKGVEGVDNPIFKNWILPDVAMLNSFRTQITYGVRPELKKDYIVKEFPKNDIYIVGEFVCGGKQDYNGLEWRAEDIIDCDKEVEKELLSLWEKYIAPQWAIALNWQKANPTDVRLLLPTTKSMVARRLKKIEFKDLVWDEKANSILNGRLYMNELNFEIAPQIGRETAKTLTNNVLEIEIQRNIYSSQADALKANLDALLHDIILVVRQRCGLTCFNSKTDNSKVEMSKSKKKILDSLKDEVIKSIMKAAQNFNKFRMRMKLKSLEMEWNPPYREILRKYTETKDKAYLADYMKQRNEWMKRNMAEANKVKMPYVYRKRGLKKWLISTATLDVDGDIELFGDPVRMENEAEWIEWANNMLNQRQDDMNDVSEEDLSKWFKDYQREYNRKFCKDEMTRVIYGQTEKIHKKHKQHKSKWDKEFSGLTSDEIEDKISALTISKQMKSQLRRRYLKR